MKEQSLSKKSYIKTAEDLLKLNVTEVQMLLPPILQKVGVASLCGSSDVGKSYMCLNLAIAICCEEEKVLGLDINSSHKSVIMVCTEDNEEDVSVRLRRLVSNKTLNLGALRFIFQTENLISKLDEELMKQPADIVIVDTLGDLFLGNLNQSIDVRRFLMPFKKLATKFKCQILFNHHLGKSKENNPNPSKNDVLGSQAIESACRTVLILNKKDNSKRVLTVVKGNNVPDSFKNKGIVFDFDASTGFQPTGEILEVYVNSNDDSKNVKLVLELYPKLKSYKKVAEVMKGQGCRVDKNKVGEIWNKHRPSVPIPEENDKGRVLG